MFPHVGTAMYIADAAAIKVSVQVTEKLSLAERIIL